MVDIERRMKRVETIRRSHALEYESLAVQTLFLEDLVNIYQQVEIIARPAEELRLQQHGNVDRMNAYITREAQRVAKQLRKDEVQPYWMQPAIRISSEEFEFASLHELEQVNREGFTEFNISVPLEGFYLRVSKSLTVARLGNPTPETSQAWGRMIEVLRRRENRLLSTLTVSGWPLYWLLLEVLSGGWLLVSKSESSGVAFAVLSFFGLALGAWYLAGWRRRPYVVIPRFKRDVMPQLGRDRIALYSLLAAIVGILVTIIIATLT